MLGFESLLISWLIGRTLFIWKAKFYLLSIGQWVNNTEQYFKNTHNTEPLLAAADIIYNDLLTKCPQIHQSVHAPNGIPDFLSCLSNLSLLVSVNNITIDLVSLNKLPEVPLDSRFSCILHPANLRGVNQLCLQNASTCEHFANWPPLIRTLAIAS